ncbi:MAG: hypothetical protein EOM28_06805 [Clostridia bacterium]|nr:hypothetical protein [Clostridia bacterium]
MKKKILAFACAVMMGVSTIPAFAAENIKVYVNNCEVVFQGQQPVIVDGQTLVPLKGTLEAMGIEVVWNEEEQSAFLKKDDLEAKFWIGKKTYAGGRSYMEVPMQRIDGSVMIPLREVVGYFNGRLSWDAQNKAISIAIEEKHDGYSTITYKKDLKSADGEVLIRGTVKYPQLNPSVLGEKANAINEKISTWAKGSLEAYLSENKETVTKEAEELGEGFIRHDFGISFKTPYYDDSTFSFCGTQFIRTDIDHDYLYAKGFTYDLKTGEKKALTDFVTLPNNMTEREYLKNIMKEEIRKNPSKYFENAEKILDESPILPLSFFMAGKNKLGVFVGEAGMIGPDYAGIITVEKSLK